MTQGLLSARLLCPWDFPGENTGVGFHFLLRGIVLTWASTEPTALMSPALAGRVFNTSATREARELLLAKSLQSRLTLYNPMDGSPPASSVHGILQARILEWVALASSRGLPMQGWRSSIWGLLCWQLASLLVTPGKLPSGASGKEPPANAGWSKRRRFDSWAGKSPWRRAWQPTPVFLPQSPKDTEPVGYCS